MHNAVNRDIFTQVGNLHTANQPNGTKTRESRWNNVVQNIKIDQFIDHSLNH